MPDWEVTVMTDSNYIKRVRVNDCYSRTDAEASALGMTGAKRVLASTPKTYKDDAYDDVEEKDDYYSSSSSSSSSSDGGDAIGFLVIAALFLLFPLWKFIILAGCVAVVIWMIVMYFNREKY
jgi:hypothetical protein